MSDGRSTVRTAVLIAAVLLFGFAAYFSFTAYHLPIGAGPDHAAHKDVSMFIYRYGRLAVFPRDEDTLKFTPYGSTRALRPPLSYLVSAALARLLPEAKVRSTRVFRYGIVLMCAATVMLTFVGLRVYFRSTWFGVLGAMLVGLMPQFSFLASYVSDDSGAIFSATLLIVAVLVTLRYGLRLSTVVLLGLSTGLVIISKLTAWLLLPFAYVILIALLRGAKNKLPRLGVTWLLALLLGGGWWIGFNMWHYGVGDPLLFRVTADVAERHARIERPNSRGFSERGVGFYDLTVRNYQNFIGETFKSTVGNLDRLRLRMGWPQHVLYFSVFALAVIGYLWRLLWRVGGRSASIVGQRGDRIWVETLLLCAIVFQIYMYVRFNLKHDIQIQGKYLIPVMLPVLVLFFSSFQSLKYRLDRALELRIDLDHRHTIYNVIGGFSALLIIGVHSHALAAYVVPFYFPQPYDVSVRQFKSVDLGKGFVAAEATNVELRNRGDALQITALAADPKLVIGAPLCRILHRNSILQISITSDQEGLFQVFVDNGAGFSERNTQRAIYRAGSTTLIFAVRADNCKQVRLDPMIGRGELTIDNIAAAPLYISQPR